jgi:uncharacterized membrane protein YdjX (TVP38/TMEM64 family)
MDNSESLINLVSRLESFLYFTQNTIVMNTKHLKTIILIIFIGVLAYLFIFTDITQQINKETIEATVTAAGIYAPVLYILIYIAATVLFIPGSILTITGGFIFGAVEGTIYTVIGATIGATIAFFFARLIGGSFIENIEKKFTKLKDYDKGIEKNGIQIMLFLRLIPLFPFAALNYAMGLTKIKARDYIFASFIGMIPGTFVYSYIGATATDIRSPEFYFALFLLALLIIIPTVIKKYKER